MDRETMIVKVCGMRDAENIRDVEALGIDWMGFIFWPHSKRWVPAPPAYLPEKCKRVGVFVNQDLPEVMKKADEYALDLLQLHGSEPPEYLHRLRSGMSGRAIIKAFNIASTEDLVPVAAYEGLADYFLFDTKGKAIGGNGEAFDWSVLADYRGNTPFLLSGGIAPDDAKRLRAFKHDRWAGIDLNSRFERSPGQKDVCALRAFLSQI